MRLQPLPSSTVLIYKLLEETEAYLRHYTPLLMEYRTLLDDVRAGRARDEKQYHLFIDRLGKGGPQPIQCAKYLDYPFVWADAETFSAAQERWLEELDRAPDAPWTAAAAVADLVYTLQNGLLEQLVEVERAKQVEPLHKHASETYDRLWVREAFVTSAERVIEAAERWRRKTLAVPVDDEATRRAFGRFVDSLAQAVPAANTLIARLSSEEWRDFQEEHPDLATTVRRLAEVVIKFGEDPNTVEEWSRFQSFKDLVRELDLNLNGGRAEQAIPAERRTRPMSLGEAAMLMGYVSRRSGKGKAKQPAENLRRAIDDGSIRTIKINRQSYVFDREDFPKEAHHKIYPVDLQ